ncbi:TPA: hypothetical protein JI173_00070 [Acinetobacter baumannii]|nr:hypothetical protein [Acinetobacter baumannii]
MSYKLNNSTKDFFKENFSSYQETKNLWIEAGGKASTILDTFDSNIRWADLFRKIEVGSIEPTNLLIAALKLYPLNKILLIELNNKIEDKKIDSARFFLKHKNIESIKELNKLSAEEASAAFTVALIEETNPNILKENKEDTATVAFKKSFATKAGELLAVAGGSAWVQLANQLISGF